MFLFISFREGGRQVLDNDGWIFLSFILVRVGGGQFLESGSWLYCFVFLVCMEGMAESGQWGLYASTIDGGD